MKQFKIIIKFLNYLKQSLKKLKEEKNIKLITLKDFNNQSESLIEHKIIVIKISEDDSENNTESDRSVDKNNFYSEKNIDSDYEKDLIKENE